MDVLLPPRLYTGRVIRVNDLVTVDMAVDLDFGVSVSKTVAIEGLESVHVPSFLRSDALAALIATVGGKRVLVCSAPAKPGDRLLGRLYLYDRHAIAENIGLSAPPGLSELHLEVASFMAFVHKHNYRKAVVVAALSGDLNPELH